jgi:hypothetical protein
MERSTGSIVALTGVRKSKKTARRSTVSVIVRWLDLAHGTVVAGATYPVSIRFTYHSTSRSRAVEGVNSGRFTPSTAYVATASSCKRSTIDPEDPHGIATLEIATALLVKAKAGHVDVEIDELISRISINPKSHRERIEARILVWRILTILGATNVVGQRRLDVWDAVAHKKVQLDSQDPLITVRAMKPRGTQESFDPGVPPVGVTIQAGPLLAQFKF